MENSTTIQQALKLPVTNNLSVTVLEDPKHEFLITTKEVAIGYGVGESTIRTHKYLYKDEILENQHFINRTHFDGWQKRSQNYWTKAGVIRLGMFIKSKQAKIFRNWAEQTILSISTKPKVSIPEIVKTNNSTGFTEYYGCSSCY